MSGALLPVQKKSTAEVVSGIVLARLPGLETIIEWGGQFCLRDSLSSESRGLERRLRPRLAAPHRLDRRWSLQGPEEIQQILLLGGPESIEVRHHGLSLRVTALA
jgi:hypothetical protein